MTQQMIQGLLSAVYNNNICHMACVTTPHAAELCDGWNEWEFGKLSDRHRQGRPGDKNRTPQSKDQESEKAGRICPRPDKVCQLQCWSQERQGFIMPLHGLMRLMSEPLAFQVHKAMLTIYEQYKEVGNEPPQTSFLGTFNDTSLGAARPAFWLPVCDSDAGYSRIPDFANPAKLWQDKKAFPLSCGNWRSSETKAFLEAMKIEPKRPNPGFKVDLFYKKYALKVSINSLSQILHSYKD
jgi:hypothetical protein